MTTVIDMVICSTPGAEPTTTIHIASTTLTPQQADAYAKSLASTFQCFLPEADITFSVHREQEAKHV